MREGTRDLRDRPLVERRAALERLFGRTRSPLLRLSDIARGDGRALYQRALVQGWEGLIAKRARSRYMSGKRTPDWRKLKIVHEQEFVIGGWTEPRQTRSHFGALLLGVYRDRDLIYAGHTGTGFDERELARLMKLLKPLETKTCPFETPPHANERPHWVEPTLVAQIKFAEWTSDGRLRHPVYLGLRDDKKAKDVQREQQAPSSKPRAATSTRHATQQPDNPSFVDQLQTLEANRRDGTIELPGGNRLAVTNLHKVFWPRQKITKGALLRYYAIVAPLLLPVVADRPLVMKRFPNGISRKPFYQHRAPEAPPGVRVETVAAADHRPPNRRRRSDDALLHDAAGRHLAGSLVLARRDACCGRLRRARSGPDARRAICPRPRRRTRWIRDELEALDAVGVPKTSGADGLHVYVRLPPGTPYEAGLLFCQIIATVVVRKHPKAATIERSVHARGNRVYVDCLQNIPGKTLAAAYSVRASDYAGVSTPLTWQEVDEGVEREDFTIATVPQRVKAVGDVWETLRKARPVDLSRVSRYAESRRRQK